MNLILNIQLTENDCVHLIEAITIASNVRTERAGNSSDTIEIQKLTEDINATTAIVNKIINAITIQTSILKEYNNS
jgi:hypothetical protein